MIMHHKKGNIVILTLMVIFFITTIGVAIYFLTAKYESPKIVDPLPRQERAISMADWKTVRNDELGFEVRYPSNFFDAGHEPKIVIEDCDYQIFLDQCPSPDILFKEVAVANLYGSFSKLGINDIPYCMHQASDGATGQTYNYYYYTTVKNEKCFTIYFDTSSTNCSFYLPLERSNTEQAESYRSCVAASEQQPKILNKIINTFQFGQ